MKNKLLLLSLLLLSLSCLHAQEFEFPLFFEDVFGEKDTIYLGYDPAATIEIDELFGEVNIKGNPFMGLDVRIVDYNYDEMACDLLDNVDYSSFHTKKQISSGNCDNPDFPAWAFIVAKNRFPIKISWDKELFSNSCGDGPVLTDWHPGGWFDAGCDNTQAVVEMSNMDSIIFETTSIGLITAENDTVNYLFYNLSDVVGAVEDAKPLGEINIFPNPTTGQGFQLSSTVFLPEAEIHIYNSFGQVMAKEKWTTTKSTFLLPHSGIFYVSVFTEGKRVATKRIVGLK